MVDTWHLRRVAISGLRFLEHTIEIENDAGKQIANEPGQTFHPAHGNAEFADARQH